MDMKQFFLDTAQEIRADNPTLKIVLSHRPARPAQHPDERDGYAIFLDKGEKCFLLWSTAVLGAEKPICCQDEHGKFPTMTPEIAYANEWEII